MTKFSSSSARQRMFRLPIALSLAVLLTSFETSETGAAESIVLEVTNSSGSYAKILEETAQDFEAANPDIRILVRKPAERHEAHLQATLRDAVTGNLADVALHGNHLVSIVVKRGIAQPIDDLIAKEKDIASLGYSGAVPDIARFDGRTYGLPWQISAPIIFYNGDLVRLAGGDTKNLPKTWPEIIALAERIQALDAEAMGGFFDYLTNGNWTLQALLNSRGAYMMNDAETEIGFAGEEGLWALQILRDFGRRGGMVDMTQKQSQQAFAAGSIGIYPSYNSLLAKFEKAADGKFEVLAGPWPIPSESGRVPAGGRTLVIQAKDPQRIAAAWRYVKYMTGPEVQTFLVKSKGAVPANTLVIKDSRYLADYYAGSANARAGLAMLDYFKPWYSFPGEHTVKIVDTIKDHLRTVVVGEKVPEEAMQSMIADVRALLPTS